MTTPVQLGFLRIVDGLAKSDGWTYSAYIRDKAIREALADKSRPIPSNKFVLSQLRKLAAVGMVVQSKYAIGLYGYGWKLTDVGREMLDRATARAVAP